MGKANKQAQHFGKGQLIPYMLGGVKRATNKFSEKQENNQTTSMLNPQQQNKRLMVQTFHNTN